MNTTQTCLALLLAFSAAHLSAAPASDLKSSKPEMIALIPARQVENDQVADKTENQGVATVAAADERMFDAVLSEGVVYWRAGSFTPATSWDDITAQASNAKPTGLVLDLRSNTTPDDFDGARRVASFLSQDKTGQVFHDAAYLTMTETIEPRLQSAPTLIVLIDRNTRGAAEVLATALQTRGALVMGQATSGKSPLVPDVTTPVSSKEEATALAIIDDRQQVAPVIAEDANRHRMCEAALVRGQDPEQDTFIAAHEAAAPAPQAPVTRDLALVEALDSLKAIRVVQGEESSPQTRVADSSSVAGQSVIASTGLSR
jgi:hypothetical protein